MDTSHHTRRRGFFIGTAVIVVTALAASVAAVRWSDENQDVKVHRPRQTRGQPNPRIASAEKLPIDRARLRSSATSTETTADAGIPAPAVRGQLILAFRDGTSPDARRRARSALGVSLIEELPFVGADLVRVRGESVAAVRQAASEHPDVASAEPNYLYRATATSPDDPGFKNLWGLDNTAQSILGGAGVADADIDAAEAWDRTKGSGAIAVGVVDTGVDYNHSDLAPNIWTNSGEVGEGRESNGRDDDGNGYVDDWRGWDWAEGDNDALDLHGHGTHVAGTIGARGGDGIGVAGVNWRVALVPMRVLGADGSGSSASIASAFAYAGENGIPIVNASLGGPGFSQTLSDTIARYPETLYVVAAGNDASNNDAVPRYPCNYPAANLICVASTTNTDQLSNFSNYGERSVDLAAPGSAILSTVPTFTEPLRDALDTSLDGRWVSGGQGPAWDRGQDERGYFLADSPTGAYAGPVDSVVRLQEPADLTGGTSCRLRYDLRLGLATGDALFVEASADGSSWQTVGKWSGSTSSTWVSMNEDLGAFDGGPVYVGYRLVAAAGSGGPGVDIDNIRIRCVAATASTAYSYYSGTSMATPHVAGAAALVWAGAPSPSASTVAEALLKGAEQKPDLAGKVVTAARLNVNESLSLAGAATAPGDQQPPSSSPTAPTQETPTVTPSPSGVAPQRPAPTATAPAPTPSPTGVVTPSPLPTGLEHPRTISLRLRGSLTAKGRVSPADAYEGCVARVPVKIVRNGRKIRKTTTDEQGYYRVGVPNVTGRYVAVAVRVALNGGIDRCATTTSHSGGGTLFRASSATPSTADQDAQQCPELNRSEQGFAAAIDQERTRRRLSAYQVDADLSDAARRHAQEMAVSNTVSHTRVEVLRELAGGAEVTQNVAAGRGVASLHRAFMASAAHRGAIVAETYERVGIGTARRGGQTWVTLIFASRPAGDAAAAPLCTVNDAKGDADEPTT